jgi:hypothetical protein
LNMQERMRYALIALYTIAFKILGINLSLAPSPLS